MKIESYSFSGAFKPLWSSNCITAKDVDKNGICTIIYLQRPKWIKDDAQWDILCKSVRLDLPKGFEIN